LTLSDDDGCAQAGYADGIVKVMPVGDGTEVEMDVAYRLLPAAWTYSGFNPFASSVDVDLTGMTDGSYDFSVQLKDPYGNTGAWATASITLNQTFCAPTGFDVTPDRSASLTVPWTLGAFGCSGEFVAFIVTDDMAAANDCSAAGWNTTPAYSGNFTFTDNTQGTKTLYLGTIDVAGNITVVSDNFEYDTRGPIIYSVTVNAGDVCTNNSNVTVTVEYKSRGGDVTNDISLSETQGSHTTWISVPVSATTTTVDLPWNFSWPPDGDYTIYALGRDDLLNTDGEGSDDIWVDGNNPTMTSMDQRDLDFPVGPAGNAIHQAWSNETTVKLVFTGVTEVGDFDFVISEAGDFSDEVLINVNDPAVTDNGGGDFDVAYEYITAPTDGGSATLTAMIRDCSGRESGTDSDAINFDLTSKGAASIDAFDAVNDPSNSLANNFSVTANDDYSGVYQMMIYEEGYEGMASYTSFATPASLTLADDGDGERTVGIYVADRAGNIGVRRRPLSRSTQKVRWV
jgi:hypothetical protein